LSFTDIVYV